jgi:hypothetical protein
MARDPRRGWEQLISILNQARAHNYLCALGCLKVHFIPRSTINGKKTPDLEGVLNGLQILCEVKTIHRSDVEVTRVHAGRVGSSIIALEEGFFRKLNADLRKAKDQMEAYASTGDVRRLAFVVPHFDDDLGEYKDKYYAQIDQYLAANPLPGVEVVFYNQRTAFHDPATMQNAVVVNEA